MNRNDLLELHYITEISNVALIMAYGILSHKRAGRVKHNSVAMEEIQDRRKRKAVPGGCPLHEYVNLYICARNPMLYKLRSKHAELCVLRINTDVLDLPGVVITDGNASSDYASFRAAPQGLKIVDQALTFSKNWTCSDEIEAFRRKSAKCAEVLVPDSLDTSYIVGAYVSGPAGASAFNAISVGISATINSHLFFL